MTELLDVSAFAPVSLAEVLTDAAAMVRVDRKYVVHRRLAQELLRLLAGDYRALEIDGRRHTSYRSTYFDTPDLDTCRAHLQRRRRRWKVRERLYLEDGLHRLEVKTRDGRGTTTKTVADRTPPSPDTAVGTLGPTDAGFIETTLAAHGFAIDASSLVPTMEVTYRRITLADLGSAARVTIDLGVACRLGDLSAWVDDEHVIVETKGGLRPGSPDRALLGLGVRPRSLSKYASTAALLHPDLADNDVRRLHGVLLHTGSVPAPTRPGPLGVAS